MTARRAPSEHERSKRGRFLKRIAEVTRLSRPDAEALLRLPRGASVRVNHLAGAAEADIVAELRAHAELAEIPWIADAFHVLSAKRELAAADVVTEGRAYIQNASSFVPVLALDAGPGHAVLDLCAAPGGKASHIASRLRGDVELWVNDASKPRVANMTELLATYGVAPAAITAHPGEYVDKYVDRKFDRILVDAQCTAEGRVDLNDPRALRFWSPGKITKYSWLQKRMAAAAYRLLRPGGVLVYATCTYAPEENEEVVDHLLRRYADADVEPIGVDLPNGRAGLGSFGGTRYDGRVRRATRVMPTEFMEAFFVARIRKGEA